MYTFERISSSKLGHPALLKDEDIDTPFPSVEGLSDAEKEDFVDASQLIANIELSQITGSIIDFVYRRTAHHDGTFVANVHKVLNDLKAWDAKLEPSLRIEISDDSTYTYSSRSVTSLKLHYNQVSSPPQFRGGSRRLTFSCEVYHSDHSACALTPFEVSASIDNR